MRMLREPLGTYGHTQGGHSLADNWAGTREPGGLAQAGCSPPTRVSAKPPLARRSPRSEFPRG